MRKTPILFLGLACALGALAQPTNVPREDFWVPDGPVHAVLETNGVVYLGGRFDYLSPVSETGRAFDSFSAAQLPDFPKFNGTIKAIITDNLGGWFVGGLFTSVDGLHATNLVHIRADLTVDTNWAPNPDGAVVALAATEQMLYAGGSFTSIGGQPQSLVAALDPTNGAVFPLWRPIVTNYFAKPSVNALVVAGDTLYLGGYFSSIDGLEREHLGAVDAWTGEVTPWFPNGFTGGETQTRVDALALCGHILYVGGTFKFMGGSVTNGLPRSFIAALNTTKNLVAAVLPWDPHANGYVTTLAVSCDTVYVGGEFTQIGGQPRNHIAALDASTGLARPWNPDANGSVLCVVLSGDTLYTGGKFTRIGGQERDFLAALDTTTGEAAWWHPRADYGVTGLALSGSSVVAGGIFGPGGKLRRNAAALDARTGRPLDWSPAMAGGGTNSAALDNSVLALAACSNRVYLGGWFTEVDGQSRSNLAAVDALNGSLLPWDPNVRSPNNYVSTLAISNGVVYVGGFFKNIQDTARTNIGALDAASGAVLPWNPGADQKVTVLARDGNLLYAGGRFTRIADMNRKRLAALNTAAATATAWNPNMDNEVSTLSILGTTIYVGGRFSTIGGVARNRLASVDLSANAPSCWDPNVSSFDGGTAAVNAVLASGDLVYAGGSFTLVAGQPRRNLAAISTDCPATTLSWDPDVDRSVNALAEWRGVVFAGGMFQNVAGRYHPHFAVFPPTASPVITQQPRSQSVDAGTNVLLEAQADGLTQLSYQWQLNGTNLPGATSPTLTVPSAQAADSGEYTLVVTNTLGLINSRPAILTVLEPLRLLTQPLGQIVAPGTTVTLSVVVSGHPPPIYQWRLNGVPIPGGIYPTLTISNAQPTNGGSYQVAVANIGGAISSDVASVVVTSPDLSLADNLEERPTYTTTSGVGSGNNDGTSREPGEPRHVGIWGRRSVWLGWIAPSSGVATFSTRGSGFDTLLAIYTGTSVADLSPVAADEDRGGFYTSRASFNAVAGTEYLVAVDGFSGAAGPIVLSWNLDTSTTGFPDIYQQPLSQVVTQGGTATFSVGVNSVTPTSFQWYFSCLALPGETNAQLTITNVQPQNVGNYRVLVMNASARVAESVEASLEIGPNPRVLSRDKVEEIPAGVEVGKGGQRGELSLMSLTPPDTPSFISPTVGTVAGQLFNNQWAGVSTNEPNHCGILGGASHYLDLHVQTNAVLVIDTMGSRIDTVLAVYYATNMASLSSNFVDCDDNGAPDGIRSWVRFGAQAGRVYRAFVDGVKAARGEIQLNWRMGFPPGLVAPEVLDRTVREGETLILQAESVGDFPATGCQWFCNGAAIPRATNATLMLDHVQRGQSGTYAVLAENEFGSTTATMAEVTVEVPMLTIERGQAPTSVRVRGEGPLGQVLVLEISPDLSSWNPFFTSGPLSGPFYLDLPTTNSPRNFLRSKP
jgi:hypothetical protein